MRRETHRKPSTCAGSPGCRFTAIPRPGLLTPSHYGPAIYVASVRSLTSIRSRVTDSHDILLFRVPSAGLTRLCGQPTVAPWVDRKQPLPVAPVRCAQRSPLDVRAQSAGTPSDDAAEQIRKRVDEWGLKPGD